MKNIILFYRVNDAYGVFSNFYKSGFYTCSVYWPTVEYYFQSQKFQDEELQKIIRNLPSPMDAATLGRDRTLPLRNDWDDIKDEVMRFAVLEKFKQNANAREILLSTGDAHFIEHTKNDHYWADGGDGTGKNMLGIILIKTRKLLREGM